MDYKDELIKAQNKIIEFQEKEIEKYKHIAENPLCLSRAKIEKNNDNDDKYRDNSIEYVEALRKDYDASSTSSDSDLTFDKEDESEKYNDELPFERIEFSETGNYDTEEIKKVLNGIGSKPAKCTEESKRQESCDHICGYNGDINFSVELVKLGYGPKTIFDYCPKCGIKFIE